MYTLKNITPTKYKKQSNNGFTLVEVLVVLALMVMLLSVTAWGVLEWQDFADYAGQEEKAAMLFATAQQRLEQRAVTGNFDQIALEQLKGPDGKMYDPDKVWPDSAGRTDASGNDIEDQYREAICYVKCDKGDYAKYSKGEKVSESATLLFTWLEDYIADKSILDAAICLEFAPRSRQVFAVFYSTKTSSFTYDAGMGRQSAKVTDICDRSKIYRKERKLGYYGVDTLYMRLED